MLQKQTITPKMEAETKKKKKTKEKVNQIPQRRNHPLQDFNGICRTTSKSKSKSSTISSSSSVSVEAPKGCLHFLLSSNHSFSSSSSSSSKPKCFTKNITTPKSAPNVTRPRSSRLSKENDVPRPISQKPKKNQTFLRQLQNGKRPMSRTAQRLNISADSASGSEEFGEDLKNTKPKYGSGEPLELFRVGNTLNTVENFTPVNKLARGSSLNSANLVDKRVEEDSNGNSNNSAVKTPPVEASVSPEIQCGSSALLISGATPLCYGAGHVLSGVTDKRKCRPRGILTVGGIVDSLGSAKDEICNDGNGNNDRNSNQKLKESRPSFIPLPAEASMRWLLSPCDEDDESKKVDSANKYRKLVGSAEVDDVASSPSMCRGSMLDLICANGDSNASGFPDCPTNCGKTRNVLLSPRRFPDFECSLDLSSEKSNRKSWLESSRTTSSCKAVLSQDKRRYHTSLGEEASPLSIGSLTGGNVIQTPESDSSSGKPAGPPWLKVKEHQRQTFKSELDSVTEILCSANLSPRSQTSMWDPLGFSSQFTDLSSPSHSVDLSQIHKNSDNMASWNSDLSLDNVSESQMRISWREGLASRIFEMDELDRCRCLSDEENTIGCADDQKNLQQDYECKDNDQSLDSGLGSPEYVEQEAAVFVKRKGKLCPHKPSTFAESISIDGGGLDASGDSDWALCYENQLFKV